MIRIKYNTVSEIELYRYLTSVAPSFTPRLDKIVDIKEYAKKIYDNALIIESWEEDILVGIIACYANNNVTKEAFITSVSVSKEYQGRGISKMMFNHLYDILRSKQFHEVTLEVSPNNNRALALYKAEKFNTKLFNKDSFILSKEI